MRRVNVFQKIFFLSLVAILASFSLGQAVWSATSSTAGTTTISVNYPAPTNTNTNTGGGGFTGDHTPPADISDLSVSAVTASSITLTWTASGNDGTVGTASQYLIRFLAYTPIGENNWDTAFNISPTPPVPTAAGTRQSVTVTGALGGVSLLPNTIYYFAMKVADANPNWSGLSNVVSGKTAAAGPTPDITPPVIQNIQTTIGQPDSWPGLGSVYFQWQVVDQDGVTSTLRLGKTTRYELGSKTTGYYTPGGLMWGFSVRSSEITQGSLDLNTVYHFKIEAVDLSNNHSETADQTFTIVWDNVPPVISNINAQPSINYAVINWATDEPADSQIVYGTARDNLGKLVSAAPKVTEHTITAPELLPNTRYYYLIRSTDTNGNQASSAQQEFTTLPDNNPPANVSNFQATAGDAKIQLSWENPSDPDFVGVVVRRSLTDFPRNLRDGAEVYRGSSASFLDDSLTNETKYYYTAFAYDTSGNYASGATASAIPVLGAPTPPPPTPPPPIPPPPPLPPPVGCVGEACEIPVTTTSTISGLTLADVDFFTARRSLKLSPGEGKVTVLSGQDLTVSIRPDVFKKEFDKLNLKIGESNYLFKLDRFGNYSTDVTPAWAGDYGATISFEYKNNNGLKEYLNFIVEAASGGLIYTVSAGERQILAGAKVELFFLNADNVWELWNASGYHQSNPQSTNSGGSYGFVVPAGTYFLRVSASGFKTTETNRFAATDTLIVNNLIELVPVPLSLKTVIEPGAPLVKNLQNIAKNLGQKTVYVSKIAAQEIQKIVANPQVQKATEEVAAPVVAGAAVVGTTAAVGMSQFLLYLRFLFTQPILVLFRRKRKGWGVIYNSLTKRPVDLVIVRLIDAVTGRIVQSRVTDKEGRYAFMTVPGRYKLEINQPQFNFPSQFLISLKDDGIFLDVYHGEIIEVKEKGALITANIPLDPVGAERPIGRIIRQIALRRLQSSLSIISMVLSVVFLAITPGVLTGVLLGVQVVFYALFRHIGIPPKPKSWGIVYDKSSRNPLGSVVARIFDKQYNKLLETQLTDKRGRYGFLVGRNEYYITYEKNGYEKRQTEPIDLKNQPEPSSSLAPDTELKPLERELGMKN